jgi:hypothetical protein
MPWKTTLMLKTPCLEIRLEKNIKCTILSMQFRHFRKAHRLRWYVNIKVAYKKKKRKGVSKLHIKELTIQLTNLQGSLGQLI